MAFRALLWSVWRGLPLPAPLPPPGRQSVAASADTAFWTAIGYRVLGPLAVRIDRAEALAAALRRQKPPFALTPALAQLVGAKGLDLAGAVEALGYRGKAVEGTVLYAPRPRRKAPPGQPRPVEPDHPFSRLAGLALAR